jgi:hypothetical protein
MPTKNPYSFKAKPVKRSQGKSAVASAAYQAGEKLTDERTGRHSNYMRKKGVLHAEILAPPNSPSWAMDRGALWNATEKAENRKDAQVARRFIIALPCQLTDEQRRDYTRRYCLEQFVERGMICDFAIHAPEPQKNQDNYHAHVMVTMREVGPEGFGKKNRDWNKVSLLEEWREQWAVHANRALEAAGHEPTWDHRTLEAQGIDRIPQIHLGQAAIEMEQRGIKTDLGGRAFQIARANSQLEELKLLEKEIQDEQRLGKNPESPQLTPPNRVPRATTPSSQSENRQAGNGGGSHEQGLEKAPPAAALAKTKPIQPITRPIMSESTTGGPEDMNLSPSEYQDFLRVKRLMAQRQEEEKQQRRLSEEQKKRIEEMIRRTEEAALKRPDALYWEDYFAMDCMAELRQRKQTVEQADWREIEGKVATGLLMDGATVKDAAEILYEKGIGAALDPATPPDGQTAGEKQVMEYLKSFAAGNPDLMDAIEQAEEREKNEARDVQREQMQQAQTAAPQPGA